MPHARHRRRRPTLLLQVLWTSIVVGCLRGYVQADVVAARQTPSYTKTFTQVGDDIRVASSNAFCATGPDGLPGVSWMELLTDLLPLVAPLFFARFLKYHGRRNGISVGCWLTIVGQVRGARAATAGARSRQHPSMPVPPHGKPGAAAAVYCMRR